MLLSYHSTGKWVNLHHMVVLVRDEFWGRRLIPIFWQIESCPRLTKVFYEEIFANITPDLFL